MRDFWIWLAGFFDGEGTLCAAVSGSRPGHRYDELGLRMSIANTNRGAIEFIYEKIGIGTVHRVSEHANHLGNLPVYVWAVWGQREIVELMEKLQPFLKVKSAHASLAQKWPLGGQGCSTKHSQRLTAEEQTIRHNIRNRLRDLNHGVGNW